MLEKPTEYQEVSAQQNEKTVYAEDINQIITNVEKLKGGQANEAPVSNIKDLHSSINELKERIDGLGNGESSQLPSSADKISFNNDNANLDFSDGYDFPRFKNELKELYEIKLINTESLNNISHIDDVQDVYNLTLEKNENKYILKGTLKYNNTSKSFQFDYLVKEIDNLKDFGMIINELLQFIPAEMNAKENEIVIEGIQNLKYFFKPAFGMPIFSIKKQDDSIFENKEYTININIEILIKNIKNNDIFIPVTLGNAYSSYLNINNINGKAVIKGKLIQKVSSASFLFFSYLSLENYFDIKTDQNDSYYIEAGSMITSNKNKPIKYYIRKLVNDMSSLTPIYANLYCTLYYFEIKHTDGSNIEYEEILTFNLTTPKNADVQKIEKEKNIQNAIEVLNKKIISSSSNAVLLNKIKKISEININISEQEMILAVYELFTYLPIQKINNNTLSFVTFPKDLASFIYFPKIQVNSLYNGIAAIPFFNKNLSSDRSYIIDNLCFNVFGISDNAFVSLVGTTDIDISQKDFSNIYTSCYIKFIYQDGFDNVEVNNSLTAY
ncbi:hypothetical protein A9X77_08530 [Brachyspira hyodysenteriae]|uniref:hypothetical protein n=1 Tax=Brachyspira hyodysenteriae TaxID=159 RepID=UPI00063DB18B|nr:hypothetical protein [Brachyspira hyodysenteriae]KLI27609.1 hypothetical protein SR30_01225 [Brachyspira hyodysenteriae]TVL76959.1 hypothetical protein A9X77_08530 [Brachyspira hyodysenteriae]TVL87493.1 hypothetical protein A9X78_10545 [Brachyspira hyodysenteriae]